MEFDVVSPGLALRDVGVLALRAIWRAFQGEERLEFEGEFYRFDLLTPFFAPGPIEHPRVPVYVAGVNPWMARMAGELCDGFHVHPFHSARYLREVVRPAVEEGARAAGRDPAEVVLASPVFAIVGDSDEDREGLREHMARGDYAAMAAEITDDMLEVYAVEAAERWREVARRVRAG